MKVIWVIILSASLLTIACLPSRIPFSAIPIPPRTVLANPEGPEEVSIDLTQGNIRDAVRDNYGKARIEIYVLATGTEWEKITQFYTERLKGGGWRPEPRFSRRKGYYEMIGWNRGGRFNHQALVIAYLEKPEGVSRNYLLVALAPEEDN